MTQHSILNYILDISLYDDWSTDLYRIYIFLLHIYIYISVTLSSSTEISFVIGKNHDFFQR